MFWFHHIITVVAFLIASTVAIHAQTSAPSGRYTMSPIDDGFIRLDTQTGAMALCKSKDDNGNWACKSMPDATKALNEQIVQLKAENTRLKEEIKQMEEVFGLNGKAPQNKATPPKFSLPTEKDVDKALDYVERMFKKFRERIERLEEGQKDQSEPDQGTTPL